MQYRHELIRLEEGLNAKIYLHSVLDVTAHWHHELELLMVLSGSVEVWRENQRWLLRSDDVLLVNRNELHSIKATDEDNVLLAIQFTPERLSHFYPELTDVAFDCCSAVQPDPIGFDRLRTHLAKIVWAFSKKKPWYKFAIEQELMALFETLLTSFAFHQLEDGCHQLRERELERLTRIVAYVEAHYAERIQLNDIARQECVTVHHLSRFFKQRMGIAFQEYLFDYRLYQAANRVVQSRDKIADIAYDCGFNDPKLFYKKFKHKYQLTPVELRRQRSAPDGEAVLASYMTVSNNDVYKPLFKYLRPAPPAQPRAQTAAARDVNVQHSLGPLPRIWQRLTTFGCAYEGLKPQVQAQLRQMQAELQFDYVRFQGIFVEQMQIVVAPGRYDWRYVDELFDFLLSIGLRPFVCLGYTPERFASGSKTVASWKGNITPPRQLEWWQDLLSQFFQHLISRYGLDEIACWYFEAWNEPDLAGIFWAGDQEAYHRHYLATYQTARRISPRLKIGGPSLSHMAFNQSDWGADFVRFCLQQNLRPDFFSYHIYPEQYGQFDSLESTDRVTRRSLGPNGSLELATQARQQLAVLQPAEYHVSEWNISACWGNKVLDTAYLGAFIVANVIRLIDQVDSLAVWTFSDLFDERGPAVEIFHGGFGLLTREGIRKPGYHALRLLNHLGDQLLDRSDNHLITRRGEEIQLLMVNCIHFDDLYAGGDVSAVDMLDPYSAFNPAPAQHFSFHLPLPAGEYRLSRYQLSREHGSAYDEWQKMGAPTTMASEDLDELKRLAFPKRSVTQLNHPGGPLTLTASVPPHGVELLRLTPSNDELNSAIGQNSADDSICAHE